MEMEGLIEKRLGNDERRRNKNQNLFLTILAMVLFVLSSWFLYRSFFLTDSLKAAQKAVSILWAAILFLTLYPFRTATLIGKLWFEYKKMELNITKPDEQKTAWAQPHPNKLNRSGGSGKPKEFGDDP